MDAFIKQQKVILPEQTEGANNLDYACTVNRNFTEYGYSLEPSALEYLGGCSMGDIISFYQEVMGDIKDFLGSEIFESTEPFYPNFPEEVMEKDEAELYLNAAVYYVFQYALGEGETVRDIVSQEPVERPPAMYGLNEHEPKILSSISEEGMALEYRDQLHGMGVSASEMQDAVDFIKTYPDLAGSVLDAESDFASNETKVKVAHTLYDDYKTDQNPDTLNQIRSLLPTVNDTLRFYAVLGAEKAGISDITPYANLSFDNRNSATTTGRHNVNFPFAVTQQDKRLIRDVLSETKDLYTGVWNHDQIWQKAFTKYLGIDKKSDQRLQDVKQNLYDKNKVDQDGSPILSPNARMERAISDFANGNAQPLESAAKAFPGIFVSRFNDAFHKTAKSAVLSASGKVDAARALGNIYASLEVSPVKTMSLSTLISNEGSWDFKSATTKTGKLVTYDNPNRMDRVISSMGDRNPSAVYNNMVDAVKEGLSHSIESNAEGKKDWGNVYIDPALSGRTVPQRNERTASENAVLPRGSYISGEDDKNLLIFGIAWTGENVDIDLSVRGYDAGYNPQDYISFSSLKQDWGIHSGDYVSAPHGAQELVIVDKEKMEEAGISYLSVEVHGYSGSFDDAKDPVRFITMEKEGSLDGIDERDFHKELDPDYKGGYRDPGTGNVVFLGETITPADFKNVVAITGEERMAVPAVYDTGRDRFVWVDEKRPVDGLAVTQSGTSVRMLEAVLGRAEQNITPSIKEALEVYAKGGCCRIVDDPKEADTVFLVSPQDIDVKEGATVHTALDSGYFSANIVPLQKETEVSEGFAAKLESICEEIKEIEDLEPDEMMMEAQTILEKYDDEYVEKAISSLEDEGSLAVQAVESFLTEEEDDIDPVD